jgi:hypothetical protein
VVVTASKLGDMQSTEQDTSAEHDATHTAEADETRAERTPVARMLANPRRVRRA